MEEKFDNIFVNFGIDVNNKKKEWSCVINFYELEFDILLIETQLLIHKIKKAIEEIIRVLEKKSSIIQKKL